MCDGADDEGEAEAWMLREKRRAALRILFVGLLVLIPSGIWLATYMDYDPSGEITRVRVVGGCAVAIGALLTVAGILLFARVRKLAARLPAARLVTSASGRPDRSR
jgi:hypothetical protein